MCVRKWYLLYLNLVRGQDRQRMPAHEATAPAWKRVGTEAIGAVLGSRRDAGERMSGAGEVSYGCPLALTSFPSPLPIVTILHFHIWPAKSCDPSLYFCWQWDVAQA